MIRKSDSLYLARFRAIYGGILRFSYTARLEMQPHAIGWEFNGEANLGKMAGGIYYYEGRATPTNWPAGRLSIRRRPSAASPTRRSLARWLY